uniref:MFS transporter n=1 Tax=Thermomicrobium roseum TaxID=500 RepID=A0A7C5RV25_THERO
MQLRPTRQSCVPPADDEPSKLQPHPNHVLAASWLAYAAFYFPRLAFAASKLGLLADPTLGLSRVFLGVADAFFLAVYAAGQFVAGALTDRVGPRRLVTLGLLTACAASLLLAATPTAWLLLAALLIQGAAQATGWAAVCSDVAQHTSPDRRGLAFGILSTSYAFGALAAPVALGWIAYALLDQWRAAPLGGAVIALAVTLVYALWLRSWSAPDQRSGDSRLGKTRQPSALLRSRPIWLLSAADFLLKPVIYATVFWTPVLVRDALPFIAAGVATAIAGLLGLAGLAGPLLAGALSDRLFGGHRVRPAVFALLGCTVALLLFPVAARTQRWWLIALVLLALGITLYAAESLIVGVAAAEAGGAQAAIAVGIVNGVGSVGGILGGLVPGLVTGTSLFLALAFTALLASLLLIPLTEKASGHDHSPR